MKDSLKGIVDIATLALRDEDEYLLGAVERNSQAYGQESGGLLRINNERYYQFVVARELISKYEFPIDIEKDTYDLVVYEGKKYKTVVEMKRWMSSTGRTEVAGIKNDINEKLLLANSLSSLMLIYSANPPNVCIESNVRWLADKLGVDYNLEKWYWASFDTKNIEGNDVVFWVAGFEVK